MRIKRSIREEKARNPRGGDVWETYNKSRRVIVVGREGSDTVIVETVHTDRAFGRRSRIKIGYLIENYDPILPQTLGPIGFEA